MPSPYYPACLLCGFGIVPGCIHRCQLTRHSSTATQSHMTSHYNASMGISTYTQSSRFQQDHVTQTFTNASGFPPQINAAFGVPSQDPQHLIANQAPHPNTFPTPESHSPPLRHPSNASTGSASIRSGNPRPHSHSSHDEGVPRIWIRGGGGSDNGSTAPSSTTSGRKKPKDLYITWTKPKKEAKKQYYWVRPKG